MENGSGLFHFQGMLLKVEHEGAMATADKLMPGMIKCSQLCAQ